MGGLAVDPRHRGRLADRIDDRFFGRFDDRLIYFNKRNKKMKKERERDLKEGRKGVVWQHGDLLGAAIALHLRQAAVRRRKR